MNIQYPGNYIEVKKVDYMLDSDMLRSYQQKNLGVLGIDF